MDWYCISWDCLRQYSHESSYGSSKYSSFPTSPKQNVPILITRARAAGRIMISFIRWVPPFLFHLLYLAGLVSNLHLFSSLIAHGGQFFGELDLKCLIQRDPTWTHLRDPRDGSARIAPSVSLWRDVVKVLHASVCQEAQSLLLGGGRSNRYAKLSVCSTYLFELITIVKWSMFSVWGGCSVFEELGVMDVTWVC